MKFYDIAPEDKQTTASPYMVRVGNIYHTYKDEDGFPYIVTNRRVLFGSRGSEHCDISSKYKLDKTHLSEKALLEGRMWTNSSIISNWVWTGNDVIQDEMRRLSIAFRKRLGLNPKNITYITECLVGASEEHAAEKFIVEIPFDEYLSIGVTGDESEFFWHLKHKDEKKPGNVRPTANGMDATDVWRHYEMVGESMKLTRDDLKQIVSETINRLIS